MELDSLLLMTIGLIMLIAILFVTGFGMKGGIDGVVRALSDDRLENFREDVEYGCQINSGSTRSISYEDLKGVEKIEIFDNQYKGHMTKGSVEIPPNHCDSVKICSSGSGYDCSEGGEIQVHGGGTVKVKVFHEFEGGWQNISLKDVY